MVRKKGVKKGVKRNYGVKFYNPKTKKWILSKSRVSLKGAKRIRASNKGISKQNRFRVVRL